MVKYRDSGRAFRRQRGRLMPFRFFFSFSVPLLYFFVSFSAWRKSRTSCQPIALAASWATQCWVIERNHWRICEDRPGSISEDDHEHFGEERVAGRASLVSSSLWWNGRRRRSRTMEACSTCPEWVQGKNRKNTVATPKKVVWAAKKWIFDRRGQLSLGRCAIGHERKENKPKLKNKKNKKNEAEKRGRELDPSGKRVPDRKNLP